MLGQNEKYDCFYVCGFVYVFPIDSCVHRILWSITLFAIECILKSNVGVKCKTCLLSHLPFSNFSIQCLQFHIFALPEISRRSWLCCVQKTHALVRSDFSYERSFCGEFLQKFLGSGGCVGRHSWEEGAVKRLRWTLMAFSAGKRGEAPFF
jgi:hypothetical protein